jgi:hypothetical protein
MAIRRCRIHYRRLRRDGGLFPAGQSLSAKIIEALNQRMPDGSRVRGRVQNRIANVPGHEDFLRLLNNFHSEDNLVFADVCLFLPGQLQALLDLSEGEEQPPLDEVLRAWEIAETQAPEGKEYLRGITYWMVIGDHFYQIQHPSLVTKSVEEYLTWLLREKTGVIEPQHHVELQLEFDRAQIGDDLTDVKSIEIGGLIGETINERELLPQPRVGAGTVEVETRETIGDRIAQTFAKAKQILIDLIGPMETQRIIDSIPPQAALEVTVNIGYRATKRKFSKEFMGNLASGLRNIPDGELRVRGRDGQLRGDDARLSAEMNVKRFSETSSLLDLEDALRQMKEVHRRFLFDGRIVE